jgi:hypothetical protein
MRGFEDNYGYNQGCVDETVHFFLLTLVRWSGAQSAPGEQVSVDECLWWGT